MRTITDRQMLNAARRRLAEHLATRPATAAEAKQIADDFRARERTLLDEARALRGIRTMTAAERGRGPNAVDRQHADAREVSLLHKEAGRIENEAASMRMRAEAWDTVATRREGAAWEEARAEYQARVDYYAGLVAAA